MNRPSENRHREGFNRFARQWLEATKKLLDERSVSHEVLPSPRESFVDRHELSSFLRDVIQAVAESTGEKSSVVRKEIQRYLGAILRRETWSSIRSQHRYGSEIYQNHQIPLNVEFAARNGFGRNFAAFGSSGKPSLMQRYPIRDGVTDSLLTNGWLSELHSSAAGEVLAYFRSGNTCHYGESDVAKRREQGDASARTLATAIAVEQLRRLEPEHLASVVEGRESLRIPIATFDLQSTQIGEEWGNYLENWVVPEHRQYLMGLQKLNEIPVSVLDSGGQHEATISVAIEVLPFNFPVHVSNFTTGEGWWRDVEELNRSSYEALKRMEKGHFSRHDSESERRLAQVEARLAELFQEYSPHEIRGNPYRYNAYLVNYAYLKGLVPHFNCRSGKDRTGMLDAESKLLAVQLMHGQLGSWDETLSKRDSDLLFDLHTYGGSAEIQRLNTGVAGSMLLPLTKDIANDPLINRIGADRWDEFTGLARLVDRLG